MTLFPETMRTPRLRFERLDEAVDAFERYEWTRASRDARERETRFVTDTPDSHPKATVDDLGAAREAWGDADGAKWTIFLRPGEPDAGGDPVEAGEAPRVSDGRADGVRETGDRVHVGVASLDPLWDRRRFHTGVALHRPYWGRGYAGERAPALLKVGFERLDLDVASVAHFEGNENSRSQMESWVDRFGGQEDGRFRNWVPRDDGDAEPWDLRSYSISAENYRDAGGAPEVELDPETVPVATDDPTAVGGESA
ncbi:GNAT family N-acetyltransferase [Halorubellus sp. JP-L1]|uniref:GNAT family N-acetyltransferase n=1 Tax=Halorubellus sp. JP-L1 TaxID=2715753 RepID=UPI0014078DC2|nr:GNAT family N-acetyltransferase [Halorubellus sp. JP-L1]NHN41200.1 GNAT family N-acetyltransferase [Halorubellus sp. JP-L1]